MAQCPSLIRVRFYPEIIYFFSVQFILNELNLNNFLTSEIFVKISSLESLATYHPENRKKFRLSQNWTKIFRVTRRDEFNGAVRFVILDIENFLGFPEPLCKFIIIIIIIFPFFEIF